MCLIWTASCSKYLSVLVNSKTKQLFFAFPIYQWEYFRAHLAHIKSPALDMHYQEEAKSIYVFSAVCILVIIAVQLTMLKAVCACRHYLSCKKMHMIALKVAENSVSSRTSYFRLAIFPWNVKALKQDSAKSLGELDGTHHGALWRSFHNQLFSVIVSLILV